MFSFKPITECLVCVLDQSNSNQQHIRNQLVNYKTRWGESLATNLVIINSFNEAPEGATIIAPSYLQSSLHHNVHTVTSINQMTHYDLRAATLQIKYRYTDKLDEALTWLSEVNGPFTADFETASKFDDDEKQFIQTQIARLDPESDQAEIIELEQQLDSSGLSHPSLTDLTHLVIGISESESFVIIFTEENLKPILEWLVTTTNKQIWHNLSFDAKHIMYNTTKFPQNYEDTQLLAWAYLNHANTFKAKVGLKGLAGHIYGDWAVSSDNFNLENKYDENLIKYAAIDGMATWFVWNEFSNLENIKDIEITENILPVGPTNDPSTFKTPRYFYENVMKPSIPDMVQMMLQGININLDAVEDLRSTVDNVLDKVKSDLSINPIIQQYLDKKYTSAKSLYKQDRLSMFRDISYYLKPYNPDNLDHRSYLIEHLLESRVNLNLQNYPTDKLPDGTTKWSVNAVKQLLKDNIDNEIFSLMLQKIINKEVNPESINAKLATEKLARKRTSLYNQSFADQISSISPTTLPKYEHAFKPNSSKQKIELFNMLDILSEDTTKAGNPKWDRAQVERVNKETNDPNVKDFTQAFIDFSFSAIIRNNFLRAFDKFVIDSVLYGNVKLAGAKTYRLTSNAPNLLNMPSSKSIYAKPLKKCLVAPPGFLIAGSDYSALEEVVAANNTLDKNKVKILAGGYDSHCFHTLYYWKEEVEKYLGPSDDSLEFNKLFKAKTKDIPELDKLRSNSKPVSFGLGYGCQPPKVAHQLKSSLEEGEHIWNTYHFSLYPDVTKYREDHVLAPAKKDGKVYLGLGLSLKTDHAEKDIRTLYNAKQQFWSLLTLLVITKMNKLIKANNLQDDIQVIATIYDSIYFNVRDNTQTIKWLNDNLIPIMIADFLTTQPVKNKAALDIGHSFADMIEIPNNASIEQIEEALQTLSDKYNH